MANEVPGLFVGVEPMLIEVDGKPIFIGPNTVVRAGHPMMEGRENMFAPLAVHYEYDPPQDAVVLAQPGQQANPRQDQARTSSQTRH